jgi:D-serine deaminase-like pyridoxal phosphate-dependent protein
VRTVLKRDIDTPALLLDLDVLEENIRTMAAFFSDRPQKLRPHFKTPRRRRSRAASSPPARSASPHPS